MDFLENQNFKGPTSLFEILVPVGGFTIRSDGQGVAQREGDDDK